MSYHVLAYVVLSYHILSCFHRGPAYAMEKNKTGKRSKECVYGQKEL